LPHHPGNKKICPKSNAIFVRNLVTWSKTVQNPHPITCEQNRRAPGYPKQNIVAGALQSSPASISSLEELQSLLGKALTGGDPKPVTAVPQSTKPLTVDDVQNMIRQTLPNTGKVSSSNATLPGMRNGKWLLDSGASNHMTFDCTSLSQTQPMTSSSVIYTADGSPTVATHTGSIMTKRLSVPKVLFIPKLSMNLLSVGQLCESGLIVTFKSSGCIDCN
jgi:hypothetical protein